MGSQLVSIVSRVELAHSHPRGLAESQGRTFLSGTPNGMELVPSPRAKASLAGEAPGVEPVAPPTAGEPFP